MQHKRLTCQANKIKKQELLPLFNCFKVQQQPYLLLKAFIQRGLVEACQVGLMEVKMLSNLLVFQTGFRKSHSLLHPFTGLQISNAQLQKDRQFCTEVVINCTDGEHIS